MMNNLQRLHSARRVLQIRPSSVSIVAARLQSDSVIGDRPWDKSTTAVVFELPDVMSPSEIKSRHLPGFDSHSPQAFEPKADKNIMKGRNAGAHFDLSAQNWERNQNKDFRSRMRQFDQQQQVFKTSRLIKYQEYGTYESNRGNISGRPCLSNSTSTTLHHLSATKSASISSGDQQNSSKKTPPATKH